MKALEGNITRIAVFGIALPISLASLVGFLWMQHANNKRIATLENQISQIVRLEEVQADQTAKVIELVRLTDAGVVRLETTQQVPSRIMELRTPNDAGGPAFQLCECEGNTCKCF